MPTDASDNRTPPGSTGRPRDSGLASRLLTATIDMAASRGLDAATAHLEAILARAGEVGLYRRWPTMEHLMGYALTDHPLIATPPDSGSLRGNLTLLLRSWTTPPSRLESAAGSVLGAAWHSEPLRTGLL